MKEKAKKLFLNWRILLLIILLLGSVLAIGYNPFSEREGAAIRSVEAGSPAELAGFERVDAKTKPLSREVILSVDGASIKNAADYYNLEDSFSVNDSITIKTNEKTYSILLTEENLGLSVYDAPQTNVRKGLDLQGGTRVLLKPVDDISLEDFELIRERVEKRLNVYGLSDTSVTVTKDLSFSPEFILIEIAGENIEDIENLVSTEGVFEAYVGNDSVFGENGLQIRVQKTPQYAGIDECGKGSDELYYCRYHFGITLPLDYAKNFAEITKDLAVDPLDQNSLTENITLYLDGVEQSSLRISTSLKGKVESNIQISGSGAGNSRQDALEDAKDSMKEMQTVIESGSLPTRLEIVKVDTISPVLGKNFINNAFLAGFAALIAVTLILYIRYRKLKLVLPMSLALVAEVLMILGAFAFYGGTLDLAAIAGIIILVGTGVDHLVIITDEVTRKEDVSWRGHIKKAFWIIFGAFITTFVALVPLVFAGAGLLKGFAITTGLGLILGVFVTRPAYGKIIELFLD